MQTTNDKMARILLPIMLGLGAVLAIVSAANAIAMLAQANPRIGDIIAFTASPDQPEVDSKRLMVHRTDRFGCVLDLNTRLRQRSGHGSGHSGAIGV